MANGRTHDPGRPPDTRVLQANERTMLAWVRTGIALITFGFVLARIGVWLRFIVPASEPATTHIGTAWIGASFVAFGAITNGVAVFRFVRVRRAVLGGREVVPGSLPVVFGIVVTVLGAALGGYVLTMLI